MTILEAFQRLGSRDDRSICPAPPDEAQALWAARAVGLAILGDFGNDLADVQDDADLDGKILEGLTLLESEVATVDQLIEQAQRVVRIARLEGERVMRDHGYLIRGVTEN